MVFTITYPILPLQLHMLTKYFLLNQELIVRQKPFIINNTNKERPWLNAVGFDLLFQDTRVRNSLLLV